MADFMTAVKTVHKPSNNEALLKEVATRTNPTHAQEESVVKLLSLQHASSPENVLSILQDQPSVESLLQVLKLLRSNHDDLDIRAPGPLQAQIINTLVSTIIPTFWSTLAANDRSNLVLCLRNLAGCSAVIARIRMRSDTLTNTKPSSGQLHELLDLHSVAGLLFAEDDFCFQIYISLTPSFKNYTKAQMGWKEFVSLACTGKITVAVARAEDVLTANDQTIKPAWMADGSKYASWLGRNAACFLAKCVDGRQPFGGTIGAAAQLLARSFGMGYPLPLVKGFITALIPGLTSVEKWSKVFPGFVRDLPSFGRRQLLEATLRWLSTLHSDESNLLPAELAKTSGEVSSIAAVIDMLVSSQEPMQKQLLAFVGDPVLSSSVSFVIRRACIAVVSDKASEELQQLLEQAMKSFGDTLFINHAPILQQEALAQTLLLIAGSLHRSTPMAVLMTARSSSHMQGVSNRLDSSNQRARWLGMVVATAISSLIDKEGSKMDFGTEDMQTDEAKWYLGIATMNDSIGTVDDFDKLVKSKDSIVKLKPKPIAKPKTSELPIINGKRAFGPERPPVPVQTEVIGEKVSEVLDDENDEDEDDDLKPYAKPDSDPEDSDEDATLVNRNKIRAPVYIRDLMRMLKDDKDHDRFQMGIKNAAILIRRKTDFGGEVRDHAEELALTLCDLQDPFETDDFDELRLQALIAVLLSNVTVMAPWLAKQAFAGDHSLSQRCTMLSALGLGGRELAGFKQDALNPTPPASSTAFPSKRLGNRLHAIYSPGDASVKRLEAASQSTSHQLIKPLALSAADETTSHLNAVKVHTFSSRMNVERTKRSPAPNQLAKIFASAFFTPLVSRFQQDVAAYGEGSVFTTPFVLVTFLKTLAILLHAAGPATLELSDITFAFWEVLLSLRVKATSDISVLEAVLFGLLTLLETNDAAKQRLAQENPKQLMETQQWVELVFERTGGGDLVIEGSGEEARVRTLAAGVLVKTKEVIETYQRLLVGYS